MSHGTLGFKILKFQFWILVNNLEDSQTYYVVHLRVNSSRIHECDIYSSVVIHLFFIIHNMFYKGFVKVGFQIAL